MANLIYILFICVLAPLLLTLPLMKGASRRVMLYLIIGICVSEMNKETQIEKSR